MQFDILTRFRVHQFAFITDIYKMYCQVLGHNAVRYSLLQKMHVDDIFVGSDSIDGGSHLSA